MYPIHACANDVEHQAEATFPKKKIHQQYCSRRNTHNDELHHMQEKIRK